MSHQPYPHVTSDHLTALFHELGSWAKVARHLGLSRWRMLTLRRRLGVTLGARPAARKRPSCLDPYEAQIAALATQGYTCREIVRELRLPVRAEQVRRFIHNRGIELLARRGAQPGEKHRDWKGGRIADKDGYILVRQPDHPYANSGGYVREHRLVMEQHLGRCLSPEEVVHHVNGDRADNRIENLELYASNGKHLAETLLGRRPNWSDEGRQRIQAGIEKALRTRAKRKEMKQRKLS